MRLRPTPPPLPQDLLDRYGEPEDTFGPNMRHHIAVALLGTLIALLGLVFCLANAGNPGFVLLWSKLMALGITFVVLPWLSPRNWVFVCPRGLIRTRGATWDAVGWVEVLRFQDKGLPFAATVRSCRVILASGTEWAFAEGPLAGYGRLVAALRRKVGSGRH